MQSLNSQTPYIGWVATTAKQIIENWKIMLTSKLFVAIVPKGHSAYSRKLMCFSGTSLIFYFHLSEVLEIITSRRKTIAWLFTRTLLGWYFVNFMPQLWFSMAQSEEQ